MKNIRNAVLNKKQILLIVFLLVIIGQSAVDIYLPSLPAMTDYFHTSHFVVQLTLFVFVTSYAVSQLIYGPLSDHFGRRPILLFGLTVFSLSSFFCALSTSIEYFLFFRLLQGFGAGAANVHQRIIIRDIFDSKYLHKYASYVAVVWALVPMIAPVVGGYIQVYCNWQGNFILLTLLEIILLFLIAKKFPETRKINNLSPFTLKKIINDYKSVLSCASFIGNVITCATLNGVFLLFNMLGPFLFEEKLGVTPLIYGWILVVLGGGFLAGSFLNSYISQLYSVNKIVMVGFLSIFMGNLILIYITSIHFAGIINTLFSMVLVFFGIGLIYPNCVANSLKKYPHIAGSAGAILGFLVSITGGLISAAFAWLRAPSFIALSFFVFLLLLAALLSYLASIYFPSRLIPVYFHNTSN